MSGDGDPALERSLHRWKTAGIVVFLLLVLGFPVYRAADARSRSDNSTARQATLLTSGKKIWADNCAACHGEQGEGLYAPALNSRQFLAETTPQKISGLVRVGIPGTLMQTWVDELGGPLTDEQIDAATALVVSWTHDAPDVPDWRTEFLGTPPPIPSPSPLPSPSSSPSPSLAPSATAIGG
ncbi:MAG: cytochrome c [Actinobacteria bacterium]|nr:cytochrome c [Actinomycetota bacterium]